jgi:hypothetical protein
MACCWSLGNTEKESARFDPLEAVIWALLGNSGAGEDMNGHVYGGNGRHSRFLPKEACRLENTIAFHFADLKIHFE